MDRKSMNDYKTLLTVVHNIIKVTTLQDNFCSGNIKIYLHNLTFLNTHITQVV